MPQLTSQMIQIIVDNYWPPVWHPYLNKFLLGIMMGDSDCDNGYQCTYSTIGLPLSNQIKSNLFAQQLTLYRQNHIHLHVLKTYYIIILQIHGYIK